MYTCLRAGQVEACLSNPFLQRDSPDGKRTLLYMGPGVQNEPLNRMSIQIEVVTTLDSVPETAWAEISGTDPFTSYSFLRLLQETGCASSKTGWSPCYLLLRVDGVLRGAVSAYLKTHSRGEFVFDHAWAEAYRSHGLNYYPKLVVSVPFTPVAGPRILAKSPEHKHMLVRALMDVVKQTNASSLHFLFPNEQDRALLANAGFLIREGVQFHWRNAAYASFDEFIATMAQEKRKKLKQDRKKVTAAGISFRWLEGLNLTGEALRFFYQCYQSTYDKHWGKPYISLDFFLRLHESSPELFVLVLAERDGVPVASALNVRGDGILYGRYWGTTEFVPGLHFETCYGQAIEYCIKHGLKIFEGGAQGEHKMARGLMPVKTFSAHWIADRKFSDAIADFLERETVAVEHYVETLEQSSPFKAE